MILCMWVMFSSFLFFVFLSISRTHSQFSNRASSGRCLLSTQLSDVPHWCPVVPFLWGQPPGMKGWVHICMSASVEEYPVSATRERYSSCGIQCWFTKRSAFDFFLNFILNFKEVESSLLTCSPNRNVLETQEYILFSIFHIFHTITQSKPSHTM